MLIARRILLPALLALGAVGCAATFQAGAAVVNGVSIPQDLLERQLDAASATPGTPVDESARLQQGRDLLVQLIQQELIRQEAVERGIEVTDAAIDEQLELIRQGESPEAFAERIQQAGFTLDEVRDQLFLRLAVEQLRTQLAPEISDSDLRDLYQVSRNDFTEARIRHILFQVEPGGDDRAAERRARQTLVEIQAGEDFERLARQRSDDPGSAESGGLLEIEGNQWTALNQLDQTFSAAASSATIGEVTEPVRSQFGWHLILVLDRRTQPFSEVKESLRQDLAGQAGDQAFQGFLSEAMLTADVMVNPRYGDWDPQTGTIVPHTFFERPEPETDPLAPPEDPFIPGG